MAAEVIEGTWEEVIRRTDLRGRRVRVIVVDEATHDPTAADPWLRQLREWIDSHPPGRTLADDSRESIYGGAADDPR